MRQFKISKSFTNRSEESLDKYLLEISRVPMITTEEEVVLAQAIHAGGKKGFRRVRCQAIPAPRCSTY